MKMGCLIRKIKMHYDYRKRLFKKAPNTPEGQDSG